MNIIEWFFSLIFSKGFYYFLWIMIIILTFFLLRSVYYHYEHERSVKDSINFLQFGTNLISRLQVEHYLNKDRKFHEKYFIKGPTSLDEEDSLNSPLFEEILSLTNSTKIRKRYVTSLSKEMKKFLVRNEISIKNASNEFFSFLYHPEIWFERFNFEPNASKQEKELQISRLRQELLEIIQDFIQLVDIPELKEPNWKQQNESH